MVFGRDRLILYSENATETLRHIDDGAEGSIRNSIEAFQTRSTDIFSDEVSDDVHRICGEDMNALAVHCRNSEARTNACIVLAVYTIANEADYMADIEIYQKDAESYKESYSGLDSVIFDRWIEQMEYAGDKILVSD